MPFGQGVLYAHCAMGPVKGHVLGVGCRSTEKGASFSSAPSQAISGKGM